MWAEIAFGSVASLLVVSGLVAVASAGRGNDFRLREPVRDALRGAGLELLELEKTGWLEQGEGPWWRADGTRLASEPLIHHGHHHHHHVIIRRAKVRSRTGGVSELRVRIHPDEQVAFDLPLDRVGE